jgi:glutathione S-transferase
MLPVRVRRSPGIQDPLQHYLYSTARPVSAVFHRASRVPAVSTRRRFVTHFPMMLGRTSVRLDGGSYSIFKMTLELITFRFCPYGHRCQIVLFEKGLSFDTTYVELDPLPDWVEELAPLGKVPLLRTDGNLIFDSTAIIEYIDELSSPILLPKDSLNRARHRSWAAFASELLATQKAAYVASTVALYQRKWALVSRQLSRLAKEVTPEPYFSGRRFSLVDAALAPFFVRWSVMNDRLPERIALPPVLHRWGNQLLTRSSVVRSVPQDFSTGYPDFLASCGSGLVDSKSVSRA